MPLPSTLTNDDLIRGVNLTMPNSPRRKHFFEVSAEGNKVKINPALMTMENSIRSRKEGDEGSDRLSMIMSMYNEKFRSNKKQESTLDERDLDGTLRDGSEILHKTMEQPGSII